MKPWGSFQVNEATNVVFMILGGCFISEIVLNLSFSVSYKKILVKSDSMFTLACEQVLHVRVSQSKRWTINFHLWENIVRPINGRERWFFTEWNFIVLDADWLLLIRNDYYAQPYRWINLYTHIMNSDSASLISFEIDCFHGLWTRIYEYWPLNYRSSAVPGSKFDELIDLTCRLHFEYTCTECVSLHVMNCGTNENMKVWLFDSDFKGAGLLHVIREIRVFLPVFPRRKC